MEDKKLPYDENTLRLMIKGYVPRLMFYLHDRLAFCLLCNNYNCKKRKFEDKEEEEDFNSKIMKSVDNVAGAIREGNIIFDRAYPREYIGEEIYRELELAGLEPYELPRALNFLAANQAKARTLFSCPLQIRMGVFKYMMGARD
ncbi:hypothetical protein Lser_V15G27631 [Lactuca serriola]